MGKKREMLPPRRVKIVESQYIEESDLIKWTLEYLDDGTVQTYVWPSCDLLKALNITRTEVEPYHLKKFCKDMLNKEINFVIDKEPELPQPNITKQEYKGLSKGLCEHFNVFKKSVEKEK